MITKAIRSVGALHNLDRALLSADRVDMGHCSMVQVASAVQTRLSRLAHLLHEQLQRCRIGLGSLLAFWLLPLFEELVRALQLLVVQVRLVGSFRESHALLELEFQKVVFATLEVQPPFLMLSRRCGCVVLVSKVLAKLIVERSHAGDVHDLLGTPKKRPIGWAGLSGLADVMNESASSKIWGFHLFQGSQHWFKQQRRFFRFRFEYSSDAQFGTDTRPLQQLLRPALESLSIIGEHVITSK